MTAWRWFVAYPLSPKIVISTKGVEMGDMEKRETIDFNYIALQVSIEQLNTLPGMDLGCVMVPRRAGILTGILKIE
jgi:hypothetical protein